MKTESEKAFEKWNRIKPGESPNGSASQAFKAGSEWAESRKTVDDSDPVAWKNKQGWITSHSDYSVKRNHSIWAEYWSDATPLYPAKEEAITKSESISKELVKCPTCAGYGIVEKSLPAESGTFKVRVSDCPDCNPQGRIEHLKGMVFADHYLGDTGRYEIRRIDLSQVINTLIDRVEELEKERAADD